MSFTKSNGLLTAALMLSVGATVNAFAQEVPSSEGIVRITDGRTRSNVGPVSNQRVTQVYSLQNADAAGPTPVAANATGGASSSCQNGNCQNGYSQGGYVYGSGQCDTCQGGRGCLLGEYYCKHSPDYGYSPPAKYPLHRRGVEYTNYYPANWYGAGGPAIQSQAPMVYAPTDTTQMGFYYQHVPFWQPQQGRLPERPIPAQWHITAPAVQASGFCRGGNCQSGYCQANYGMSGGTVIDSNSGMQDGGNIGPSEVVPPIQSAPSTAVPQQAPNALPGSPAGYDQGSAPNPLPQLQSAVPQLQSNPQTLIQTSNVSVQSNVPTMTLSQPLPQNNVAPRYYANPNGSRYTRR